MPFMQKVKISSLFFFWARTFKLNVYDRSSQIATSILPILDQVQGRRAVSNFLMVLQAPYLSYFMLHGDCRRGKGIS